MSKVTSEAQETEVKQASNKTENFDTPDIGAFIAATYNDKWYVGKVMAIDDSDGELHVSFMTEVVSKTGVIYKWPKPCDDLWVSRNNIICKISAPLAVGRSKRTFILDDTTLNLINTNFNKK